MAKFIKGNIVKRTIDETIWEVLFPHTEKQYSRIGYICVSRSHPFQDKGYCIWIPEDVLCKSSEEELILLQY